MNYKSLIAASFAALFLYMVVFAQVAIPGTVIQNANLRAGPGATYAVVGTAKQGQAITIAGKNPTGTWYHLSKDQWIAATLVKITNGVTTTLVPTPTTTP